jgi:ribosomal protein S16
MFFSVRQSGNIARVKYVIYFVKVHTILCITIIYREHPTGDPVEHVGLYHIGGSDEHVGLSRTGDPVEHVGLYHTEDPVVHVGLSRTGDPVEHVGLYHTEDPVENVGLSHKGHPVEHVGPYDTGDSVEYVRLLFEKVTCFSYDVTSEMTRHSLTVQYFTDVS